MRTIFITFFILLNINILYANSGAVKNEKVVNIAFGFDKPPFVFGKYDLKGIEPDILIESFDLMGYKVNGIRMTKNKLETALSKDCNIDGVSTISPNNPDYFYSDDFTTYENYVITKQKDHIKIKSIDDLKHIKFVAWKDAYYDLGDKFYKYFNPVNGKYKQSYHDSLIQSDDVKLFFSGKLQAIIIDKTIFSWYKNLYQNNDTYIYHKIFPKRKVYPVSFKDKKIRDIFNQGLRQLKRSGRYQQIIDFYQRQNISQLKDYVDIISSIASKYLYVNDYDMLNKILKKFFIHPDIENITINNLEKNIFKVEKKDFQPSLTNFKQKIYYGTNNDILKVGTLYVYYSKDFKSNDGVLIPPLSKFRDLPEKDFNLIKKIYKEYNIIDLDSLHLTQKEKNYIKNHKTITVHNESTWAPYNFNENGVPKGFMVDYMDLIAKKLNINVKYINSDNWGKFINLIKTEQLDVISNIAYTKDRANYINFTKPFMRSKKAIFSNISGINNFEDLNGKTVAIPSQFYLESYLQENYPKIKIKSYHNVKECLYAVINHEADALIETYAVVNYLIKKNGLLIKYITIKDNEELNTDLHFGIRKSQPILRDILQKGMDSVTSDEFSKLENKWFGLTNQIEEVFTNVQTRYLKNKKTLKICTNPNWRPIEFTEDGVAKGITIDIMDIVTKKLNLKPIYIKTKSWKQSQQYLEQKKCDILASAIHTKQREAYANFTQPYLIYDLAIITQDNKPLVSDLSKIVEKTMARKASSGVSSILREEYPNLNIVDTKNMNEAYHKVIDGSAYFTVATLPNFAYNKKYDDLNSLRIAGYNKRKCELSIAVRDDDKILLTVIDHALKFIPKDAIKIINDKWTTLDVIKKPDYTLVWSILIVTALIVLIIAIAYRKQYKLKQEIHNLNLSLQDRVTKEIEKNREKEKLMLHQSRLAQMGEMISMIAHQWRQPLNSLSMLNQSLLLKYSRDKLDDEFVEYFKVNSKNQIQNMSHTIDDFRNFFKPEKEKTIFCINKVISNTLYIVKPIFNKHKIQIVFHDSEKFDIVGYPNELGQALLNIINNSKDALIENIETNRKIEITLHSKNGNLIITIKDNAGGIPSDVIDKIFDPYFSTKDEKNGTGLGLYMTKLIIEDHMNGKLNVSNSKDGAIFEIVF